MRLYVHTYLKDMRVYLNSEELTWSLNNVCSVYTVCLNNIYSYFSKWVDREVYRELVNKIKAYQVCRPSPSKMAALSVEVSRPYSRRPCHEIKCVFTLCYFTFCQQFTLHSSSRYRFHDESRESWRWDGVTSCGVILKMDSRGRQRSGGKPGATPSSEFILSRFSLSSIFKQK